MAVTRAQFDAYARRNAAIDANVKKAVDRIWGQLDTSSMEALLGDLATYLPLVAEKFGKVSALTAAEFYDLGRNAASAGGAYEATTAAGALWMVDRDLMFVASGGFDGDVRSFLTQSVQGVVRDYGRRTIAENSAADHWCDGYTSMPTSDNPCAFCQIKSMASFWNYGGRKLEEEVTEDAWHANCSCVLVPTFSDKPPWVVDACKGYEDNYNDAAELIRSGDMPEDLQARIDAAREQHAKLVAEGKSDKRWSSFNEITIAMRYQNEGMH